jgi:hypothetical protein
MRYNPRSLIIGAGNKHGCRGIGAIHRLSNRKQDRGRQPVGPCILQAVCTGALMSGCVCVCVYLVLPASLKTGESKDASDIGVFHQSSRRLIFSKVTKKQKNIVVWMTGTKTKCMGVDRVCCIARLPATVPVPMPKLLRLSESRRRLSKAWT